MADDKIDDLIKRLASRDSDLIVWRWKATKALVAIGEPAVPALIEALKDEDGNPYCVREALIEIGKPAVPALIGLLKDKNVNLRWRAVWALGEIKDARAVPGLIEVLKDENVDVQGKAAEALEGIIPSLTYVSLREMEGLFMKALEKAEGKEKEDLLNLLKKINEKKNEILEPEVKKLKLPKSIKRRGKPKRRIWRAVQ